MLYENFACMSLLHRSPKLRASLVGAIVALVVAIALIAGALSQIRADLTTRADALHRTAAALPELVANAKPAAIEAFLAGAQVPIRVVDAEGTEIGRRGSNATWADTGAGAIARLATSGSGVTLTSGAVEVQRTLAGGLQVAVRSEVDPAAMTISGGRWLAISIAAIVAGLIAAVVFHLMGRPRRRETAAITLAAESLIAGRAPEERIVAEGSDLARAADAIRQGSQRLGHLTEVADRELGLLAAAIEPLPVGVLGRGPAGGHLRNLALERLGESLPLADRTALETALREGLESTDPVGGRVRLSDGRLLELDAWTVPGGRLVAVTERSEQDRLATLRRQLEGTAARQLRAPIDEIKTRGKELYQHVPAPAAPTLRSILAATDRLDRVVRMMLRGTEHDSANMPPAREVFGVAGFLWGLAHDWDAALRQRALRVELDIESELPDVRTDPALVQEILTELIDNAAKFSPRGGTVKLGACSDQGNLVLEVRDSGAGIEANETQHVTERFFRGHSSESIPGAGLGLGVAAALAERLGGSIDVLPGPGGHVRLMLPLAGDAKAAA